ncbi:MAG TPA: M23 family metallopeptidase [Gemmatimonadaceae bacterium]
MIRPFLVRRRSQGLGVAAIILASSAQGQSYQRQAPVEVTLPKPPTPVVVSGTTTLVYELHVTNFGQGPMALRSVDVFSRSRSRPIATLSDSALRSTFQIGARMRMQGDARADSSDALRIDVGQRAVVFMWVKLDRADKMPTALRHRLQFALLDGANTPSVIDDLVTPVNHVAAETIGAPMRGGTWLAGDGPSNGSGHRRALIPLDGRARISQRFAFDWMKIGPNGNTWHDDRSRNENFWGFGEPVLAVADGEVVSAIDSMPDNVPGTLPPVTVANISGNHVILRLVDGRYALYAHLQRGSVRVHAGQSVHQGQAIAHLGNSGQATGPHLHFQLMDAPSDLAAEGIPFRLSDFTLIGYGRDYEPGSAHLAVRMADQLPVDDAIVRFPGGK